MKSSTPTDLPPATSGQTVTPPVQIGAHYYRFGIIGSKESGKTCLITSLSMLRDPNPQGLTADLLPPLEKEDAALTRGRDWISQAKTAIEEGRWPIANPNDDEYKAIRFRMGDGQTRQKYVEVFDYSGDLLNPRLSDIERAAKLRDLLGQMDGLLVIAEHPLSAQDISKVEGNLNGLMQAFALLSDEKATKPKPDQAPIALIVNKWDRSEHFDQQADAVSQTRLLEDKYLRSSPPPYHLAVANALRPAAPDHFKIFAVSAMGPVEREGDRELPPKGKLHSMGSEDPFLWLIRQVDQMELADLKARLDSKRNWAIPWPPEWRKIARLKSRIPQGTPERPALNGLSRKSWLQFACGLFIWLGLMPAVYDGWQHHQAETAISDPQGDWQVGANWLRDYASSNPLKHILYKRFFSASDAAERTRQVTEQKDNAAFESIPKLSAEKPGLLDEADKLASEQLITFPNSTHSDGRKSVLEQVGRIRRELAFEKELSQWQQEHDKILSDRVTSDQEKLVGIQALEGNVSVSSSVPLDGPLRGQWSALLQTMSEARRQLGDKITTGIGLDKIRQALDAADYLKASDLLADWAQPQDAAYKELLNQFQSNVASEVEKKADTTSQQGAKWSDAVNEAEQFLQPSRRPMLTDANVQAIQSTIHSVKMKGDEYFYESARKPSKRNTETLNAYLTLAPLQSMADEVSKYIDWLDEREKPRKITFKLTEIEWADSQNKQDYTGGTKIKLFVDGSGDSRNEDVIGDTRVGTSSDTNGLREVTLDGIKQTQDASVSYQIWNTWGLVFKDEKQVGRGYFETSAEELFKDPVLSDSEGGEFTIEVEGVLPKPDLPSWREKP